MSATGSGGCGPGPGATSGLGSGTSNPRKFSEKIALHTQRQAEETAAFQEVMMDITSTRVSECEAAAAGGTALAGGGEALLGVAAAPLPLAHWAPCSLLLRSRNRARQRNAAKSAGLTVGTRSRLFPIRR